MALSRTIRVCRTRKTMTLLDPSELSARISLALRRTPLMHGPSAGRLLLGDVVIDFRVRQVTRRGQSARLTPKEFNLLAVANANKVLSDRELLQAAWGPEYGTERERLRVVVRQLRKNPASCAGNPSLFGRSWKPVASWKDTEKSLWLSNDFLRPRLLQWDLVNRS